MSGGKSTRLAKPQLSNFVGTADDLPLVDLLTRRNLLKKMMLEKLNDPRDYRNIPTMELTGKTGGVHFPVDTNKCQGGKSFAE